MHRSIPVSGARAAQLDAFAAKALVKLLRSGHSAQREQ